MKVDDGGHKDLETFKLPEVEGPMSSAWQRSGTQVFFLLFEGVRTSVGLPPLKQRSSGLAIRSSHTQQSLYMFDSCHDAKFKLLRCEPAEEPTSSCLMLVSLSLMSSRSSSVMDTSSDWALI